MAFTTCALNRVRKTILHRYTELILQPAGPDVVRALNQKEGSLRPALPEKHLHLQVESMTNTFPSGTSMTEIESKAARHIFTPFHSLRLQN